MADKKGFATETVPVDQPKVADKLADRLDDAPVKRQSRHKPRTASHPTEVLPPDPLVVKQVSYDQVRAIAMAPRDGIGGFGWAALGGLAASLPATAQDIWASYISQHAVALPPGRLVDILVTAGFAVAFAISRFKTEATSTVLLKKLFPEKIED
jgi:hypothetical protein